jgi:hypothetical protein
MEILNLLSKALSGASKTSNVVKTTALKTSSLGANPFVSNYNEGGSAFGGYAKNNPQRGGYFAGYYNNKPNIVGQRLFIEV